MTDPSVGALLGLLAGLGVVLLVSWHGDRRPMTIAVRIAPFVGTVAARSVARPPGTAGLVSALVRPAAGFAARSSSRALPTRLAASGEHLTPSQYRLERMGWAAVGAAVGMLAGAALAAHGSSGSGVLILGLLGAAAGWWGREAELGRRIRRRRGAIERHLPVLADLAALAVTGGRRARAPPTATHVPRAAAPHPAATPAAAGGRAGAPCRCSPISRLARSGGAPRR
jgi:tight adherence protein C